MLDSLLQAIEDWIRELFTGMVNANLTTMFTDVNEKTSEIAAQVGQTPQGWNGSVFSMIQGLSNNVIVPIAGIIITMVLCYELITMLTERNNLHDVDTWMFFKYFVKMWIAVYLVSNTFTIVMAVFDVGQSVVSSAAGYISGTTAIDVQSMIGTMDTAMEAMEIPELMMLALETALVSLCMKILSILIMVILYGRMIEIYLYDKDEDGNMVIVAQEAEIVRTIYKSFVQGVHPSLIAIRLNGLGLKTVYGNDWSGNSVRNILRNEKYCGDVLMQKTITVDYLSHVSKPNEGEAEQYYIADHHDAIVSREMWDKAQELLEKQSWQKWKRREQQRLMPVRTGLLKGFISISGDWKVVSLTRLLTASKKVLGEETVVTENSITENKESEEMIMSELAVLEGFEVVELEQSTGDSVMTLTSTNLKFNKATAVEWGYPSYVRMLTNAATRQIAIQPCKENTKNAVEFSKDKEKQNYAVVVKVPALLTAARKMADLGEDAASMSFRGVLYPNDNVIIYDLSKGEPVKRRGKRKPKNNEEEKGQAAEE